MREVAGFHPYHRQAAHSTVRSHEVGHERGGGTSQDLGRGVVLLEHTAGGEHGDPVTELGRLLDVMGDEDDRLLEFLLQLEELVLESLPGDGIHRAERLVHEQHRGVGAQRPGHPDSLALSSRELVWETAGVAVGFEADQLEQLVDASLHAVPVPAEQPGHDGDVVEDPPMREEPALLDHVADAPAHLHGVLREHVLACDEDTARGRLDEPVDHPQRGGLAAARRAHQDGELPVADVQSQVCHRHGSVAVALGDPLQPDHRATIATTFARISCAARTSRR